MKRSLVIYFFLLLFGTMIAQEKLTMDQVLQTIEKSNPLLQSYKNKVEGDKAMIGTAKAWMPPKTFVQFDRNPYSFNNFYNGMVTASFMQDFPNKKVIEAKTSYLQSLSQINVNESEFQKNKLFTEAKEAYYGIYISRKTIQVLKESIALLKLMIELSEKQMATGKEELATIFKLKARLASKETMLVHDENMIKAYMATINYLMNTDVNQTFTIDTSNIIKDYRNLVFNFTKDSIEIKRSDIMQMNSIITSMKLDRNIIKLNSKPIFGLRFDQYFIPPKSSMYTSDNPAGMFSIMGTMTIPFAPWAARSYKSETKAMEFRINGMEQQKENMINMTSQMIKMLVIEMNSEYQEIDNYTKKIIPAYKNSFDAYLLAYGQNTSDLVIVLLAYDDLQMAQMEYIKHLEVLFKVQIDYEKELQIR